MNKDIIGDFIEAVVKNQAEAEGMLKKYPSLLNSRWIHNETILHFLAVENYAGGVKFLAEAGADINLTNEFGDTALIDVSVIGNVEIAEILLRYGANPNAQSETNDNPLHCAISSGNTVIVGLLLDHGANHNYTTYIGETPTDVLPQKADKRKKIILEFEKRNKILS